MAGRGNAKADPLGIGDFDLDAAWARLAGEIEHAETQSEQAGPGAEEAEGRAEEDLRAYRTEEDLRAYLERLASKRAAGFPPMEALTARLGEFAEADGGDGKADSGDSSLDRTAGRAGEDDATGSAESGREFAWFERAFVELRGLFANREDDKREIVAINEKLSEILDRVDKLSASMPEANLLSALESRLASVSQSLDTTRMQSAADADRISRAAEEIFAATRSAKDMRLGFEAATRQTIREFGKTMMVASTKAAYIAARQVGSTLKTSPDNSAFSRLEQELRALKDQSRQSEDKTAAALDRVRETLRTFLEGGGRPAGPAVGTPFPKRRAGVHMPISADAPVYSRPDAEFGSAPVSKPALDTITLRQSRPPDLNFVRALQEADERLQAKDRAPKEAKEKEASERRPTTSPLFSRVFREEDGGLPLIGIGIVAFILLIASAVLYYLHARTHLESFHFSSAIAHADRTGGHQAKRDRRPAVIAVAARPEESMPARPALFAGIDQAGTLPASQPTVGAEDLQALTESARRGDADAQFRIGIRFLNEAAIAGDPHAAARWFERAAAQGHVEAEFTLATLYERGQGVPKDLVKAVDLYRSAAAAGHALAMHNLGVLLAGRDTTQDYREAARWFAASNLPESQYNLALLYEYGLGVRQDLKKAYALFKAAARSGDGDAGAEAERLKRLLQTGDDPLAIETRGWRPSIQGSWQATVSRG